MEGVRRGPPNAVRHHGEEKEEEEVISTVDTTSLSSLLIKLKRQPGINTTKCAILRIVNALKQEVILNF
jgi:hypothetical protein